MGEPKLPVIGIPVKEMFGKFNCCKAMLQFVLLECWFGTFYVMHID